MPNMPPLKLYLLRSVYDWAVDTGCTPHVIVDAAHSGVAAPSTSVQDGKIVLNIHPRAVERFELTGEALSFSARFGGRPFSVYCPLGSIRAVYARENGQGMAFPESEETPPGTPAGTDVTPPRKGPVLRRIK
jgi:stringent starvation protein B